MPHAFCARSIFGAMLSIACPMRRDERNVGRFAPAIESDKKKGHRIFPWPLWLCPVWGRAQGELAAGSTIAFGESQLLRAKIRRESETIPHMA